MSRPGNPRMVVVEVEARTKEKRMLVRGLPVYNHDALIPKLPSLPFVNGG